MRVNATTGVVRFMGEWVRRADHELARSAARNAARSMHTEQTRRIDDARTLRDLERIPPARSSTRTRRRVTR